MLKIKCFIVGGMILSSLLYVKAFASTNNTAACVAAASLAVNAANAANANKVCERDNDEKPGIVMTVFTYLTLLSYFALLFICLLQLTDLFLRKHDGI